MTTAYVEAAHEQAVGRSHTGASMLADLMAEPIAVKRLALSMLPARDLDAVISASQLEFGTPYGLWVDDPVGFVEQVLGESTWSLQRAALESVGVNARTAVPSCFGTGKTHIAARAVVHAGCVYAPGTSLTVSTATRMRQVQRQLWPHIRGLIKRHRLPGHESVGMTQWYQPTPTGDLAQVAYGFSAPAHDESAVQGIHAQGRLLVVVDEAGGIGRIIGQALRGILTGEETALLAIGNPPTDDEGSWFESLCLEDNVNVVRIAAEMSPNMTGERVGHCLACPAGMRPHSLATHLVDQAWVTGTVKEHGEDSPYVVAKVHARFPRGGSARAIPASWVDSAVDLGDEEFGLSPDDEGMIVLGTLVDERDDRDYDSPRLVEMGDWVRLGVDVAADGGDEFAIARSIGTLASMRHTSSGAVNANPHDVAGVVLREIRRADKIRRALGTTAKVRVKVDAIGVGWGVCGILEAWASEGIHDAEIVRVVVSEGVDEKTGTKGKAPARVTDSETLRPALKRDEMWLAGRALLAPADTGQPGQMRLEVDDRTKAQFSAPNYGTTSLGRTKIESKKSMKQRGVRSPDRAEAVLLCLYEPKVKQKRGLIV